MTQTSRLAHDLKVVRYYLAPSAVSFLVAVIFGCTVTVGVIAWANFGMLVLDDVLVWQALLNRSRFVENAQTLSMQIAASTLLSNIVYYLFWGLVGLGIYIIVDGAYRELRIMKKLADEMHYVHADRRAVLRNTAIRALIRTEAVTCWVALVWYMLYRLIPYAITVAQITVQHEAELHDWLRCGVVLLLCVASAHGFVVLLRFAFLKLRLIGDVDLAIE